MEHPYIAEMKKQEKPNKQVVRIGKYKRCSTNQQDLYLQNEQLNKTIERMKEDHPNIHYEVLDFEDNAISGKSTKNRPAINRMLEHVKKGNVNIILFTKLDRLARSLQNLLEITSELEKHGVDFKATEQNIDTSTAQGKLLFQIIGAFSEFERSIIQERLDNGREKAKQMGTKSGKPMHRPKLELDEDGVWYKYKCGWSMNQIAKSYGKSITPIRRIIKERMNL